jgi:hypothetical protein
MELWVKIKPPFEELLNIKLLSYEKQEVTF